MAVPQWGRRHGKDCDVGKDEKHPIVAGLLALVGVGLAVGLLLGLSALAVTKVAGLGGGGGDASAAEDGASLYLPTPSPTDVEGPLTTLGPGVETPSATSSPSSSASAKPKPPKPQIVLNANPLEASAMQQIDLTGTYAKGEGAVLQVQRMEDGAWQDFPVTEDVTGGVFSTYIQTGQLGEQKFRMRDTESGLTSNVVTITIR